MLKRLILVAISSLVLVVGLPGAAWANGDGGAFDELNGRTRRVDPIWQGLCVGASLDLSQASQISCAYQSAARSDPGPVPPPNIEAGLCVGASLDLSRASAAKCIAATQKPSQPAQPPNIEQGLCVGASLDLSAASAKRCAKATGTTSNTDQPKSHTKSKHSRPPATQAGGTYAALGDSVAAGVGAGATAGGPEICGRTFSAYAYAVGNERGLTVNHLACSGATLGDLFTQQGVSGPNLAPQLDGAFASGTPQLVTITAGANDVRWDDFLRKCYADTCGTATDEQAMTALLATLDAKTRLLMKNIEQRSSGTPPEVILTGYYNPVSNKCTEIEPRITTDEITWLKTQTKALNRTLQSAANQYDFAKFVPVSFRGHDICSNDPWIQRLEDPAPFHPTAEGQQAIANAIT